MPSGDAIIFSIIGFAFAQFFTNLGVQASLGGFKIHHMFVGLVMMVAAFATKRKKPFYFGFGIAVNDFLIHWFAGDFAPKI
ncbi:hypothetical protein HYS54_00720 [Candidatus Micrarchaeota archaeon]|nr:hypothetical protein [Candidatus Micrarchaeota archaeon]